MAHLAVWLNAMADPLGRFLLAPIDIVPGWLSATAIAVATGLLSLVAFKYTSDQGAIRRIRNDIDAHLLALRLFNDSARVAFRAQGRIMLGAGRLFVLAVVPMLVMVVPVSLLLGQLGLWFEARPLRIGEEAVITLELGGAPTSSWPDVSLRPDEALEVAAGPVRVRTRREVCWNVIARTPGLHRLVFLVGDREYPKELAVGEGFMRVSSRRPGWEWPAILLNPEEDPFGPDEPVRSIAIEYPKRSSWTSGSGSWMTYWFVVSMVSAMCFRRALNVQV
jgi:hypothetical protein